jgi:chemotaxis signal transduction protein
LNLRGRIVTAIDMRRRLEANRREDGAPVNETRRHRRCAGV